MSTGQPEPARAGDEVVQPSLWSPGGYSAEHADREAFADQLELMATVPAYRVGKRRNVELMNLRPGDRALDAGCGPGCDLDLLEEAVGAEGQVVGADTSAWLLEHAHSRTRGAQVICADIAELPFTDGYFDAVRADRVLQHHRQPIRALRELHRVTRPGGRVVISEVAVRQTPEQSRFITLNVDQRPRHDETGAWMGTMLPALFRLADLPPPRVVTVRRQLRSLREYDACFYLTLGSRVSTSARGADVADPRAAAKALRELQPAPVVVSAIFVSQI